MVMYPPLWLKVWEFSIRRTTPLEVHPSMELGQRREDTQPPCFSTLTPLPDQNVGKLPPITTSTFTIKSPENTPLTNRASTSANPDLIISLTFVEANYEVLESLLRDRRRQVRIEDLPLSWTTIVRNMMRREREMEPRPAKDKKPCGILLHRPPYRLQGSDGEDLHLDRSKESCYQWRPKDHKEGFDRFNKGFSWDNNKGKKKNQDRFSLYKGSNHGLLTILSKSPREILATENVAKTFEQPPRMLKPSIRLLKVDSKIPLIGFSGEHFWPLREARMLQKSQEKGQNRTNTDRRTNRVHKSPEISKQKCGLVIQASRYKLAKGNVMRGSHWSKHIRIDTRIRKEAHQGVGFYAELLVKEA
ncbi:hypothetical protein Tco_0846225 [Tanacetum coccineum]